MNNLTQSELKELLDYNPGTGVFVWKVCRNWKAKSGDVAGFLHHTGYWYIRINYRRYLAHRLVWLYVHGCWPEEEIDHINHVRDDNRIINLREASRQDNCKNASLSKINTSMINGVSWNSRDKKWRVDIRNNGKHIYGGQYTDLNNAVVKRKQLEKKYGYHENHGRNNLCTTRKTAI